MTEIHLFSQSHPVCMDRDRFERLEPIDRTLFVLLARDAGHRAALPDLLELSPSAIDGIARQKHVVPDMSEYIEDVMALLSPLAWRILELLRRQGVFNGRYAGLCEHLAAKFPAVRDSVVRLREEELVEFSSRGRDGIRLAITGRGVSALEERTM